eukprot:gene6564-3541_t
MLVDVVAALPFDILISPTFGVLRLVKMRRVPTFFPIHGLPLLSPRYAIFHHRALPLVMIMLKMMLLFHSLTWLWMMVKMPAESRYAGTGDEYVEALYFVVYH